MEAINSNAMYKAQSIIDGIGNNSNIKRVKKDRGLMERSEASEKIILEEDNRMIMFG